MTGDVPIDEHTTANLEALMRLLVTEGLMTPVAERQIAKVLDAHRGEGPSGTLERQWCVWDDVFQQPHHEWEGHFSSLAQATERAADFNAQVMHPTYSVRTRLALTWQPVGDGEQAPPHAAGTA